MGLRNLAFVVGGAMQGVGQGMIKDAEERRREALAAIERSFRSAESSADRVLRAQEGEADRGLREREGAAERTSREKQSGDQLEAARTDRQADRDERSADRKSRDADRDAARDDTKAYREGLAGDRDADRETRAEIAKGNQEIRKREADKEVVDRVARAVFGTKDGSHPKLPEYASKAQTEEHEAKMAKLDLEIARRLRAKGRDDLADDYDPDGATKPKGLGTQQVAAPMEGAAAVQEDTAPNSGRPGKPAEYPDAVWSDKANGWVVKQQNGKWAVVE